MNPDLPDVTGTTPMTYERQPARKQTIRHAIEMYAQFMLTLKNKVRTLFDQDFRGVAEVPKELVELITTYMN